MESNLLPLVILSSILCLIQFAKCYELISPEQVLKIANEKCLLLNPNNNVKATINLLMELEENVFDEMDQVFIGTVNVDGFLYPDKTDPKFPKKQPFILQKIVKNRECLMKALNPKPNLIPFTGILTKDILIEFVNNHCNTYKTSTGALSSEGLHRQAILQSLFHVKDISYQNIGSIFKHDSSEMCNAQDVKSCLMHQKDAYQNSNIPKCDRISVNDAENFFDNYLKISKPVIIEGAMKKWKTHEWSMKNLRQKYGEIEVHIKLTSTGEYEGVEPVNLWEGYEEFSKNIPKEVKEQLLFPNLVVVRPATLNLKLSDFLDLIESISKAKYKNISAYLEYSSIREYFPDLEKDISEMGFIKGMLNLKHLNIWLSDGNTLGKTHFDPFDNFLCQISGKKEVILFEPHNNTKLYEAHIPEAMLSLNKTVMKFSRKHLSDSTSLVMSPVDILKPDLQRFPKFADAYPINCTINEGDVLFMPAFWWHEVQSYPSQTEGRNLAVNFWYEPFLTKEFPCAECTLDVNPIYRLLL